MDEISKIGVIGAGSWGTALANLLAGKGADVHLWVREDEVFNQIKSEHINRVFLPGVKLDPGLKPVKSFEEALHEKELILMVVPSHVFREVMTNIKPHLRAGMSFITATKGIENDTLMIITDQGKIIRLRVADISIIGRNTQGVRLINLGEGEKVIGVAKVMED